MHNKSVIVFGASGAVGAAIIKSLQLRGITDIIGTYNNNRPEIHGCHFFHYDVKEPVSVEFINSLCSLIKHKEISIIYTIGMASSKQKVTSTPIAEWEELLKVNCLGFGMTYKGFQHLFRRNGARIIVFSSNATKTSSEKNGPYTASKVALESLVITLAKEEREYGVRLNVIAPSLIDSPLADKVLQMKGVTKEQHAKSLPWGRSIELAEISEAAVSLAVDDYWKYISGQVIRYSA